ncbi:MAG: methyltransferase dimerization domain-containing protein, partial [Candidatus Binatota bacterium]
RLSSGHAEARIVQVAVSLGLFDLFKDTELDAVSVAASIQAEPRATDLLLNALTALGLLRKNNHFFSLSEVAAAYLVRSSAKFLGDMILFESSLWDCWGDLEKTVRTGKAARVPDMYQGDAQATERFIRAMHS